MRKPGFPTCGEPVEPHPCLWGRQPHPTAVGTWGNRTPIPLLEGRAWEGAACLGEQIVTTLRIFHIDKNVIPL